MRQFVKQHLGLKIMLNTKNKDSYDIINYCTEVISSVLYPVRIERPPCHIWQSGQRGLLKMFIPGI